MKVENISLDKLKPYENNPRINDQTVNGLAESISQFGFLQPIVIDKDNIIVVGHTRFKAAQQLELKTVPVVRVESLTPEQVRAYRIIDNKIAEKSQWNLELLQQELAELEYSNFDLNSFDLDFPSFDEEEKQKYTSTIKIPVYEKSETIPELSEVYDESFTKKLIDEINAHDIPDDVRAFLLAAAQRHTQFNYTKVADFYAHAEPVVQRLMENSALVLVDINKAIENGWASFSDELTALFSKEQELE